MRVEVSRAAENDLHHIADFIANDNPARARSYLAELGKACVNLGHAPLAAQPRPEFGEGMRSRPHGRYLIFFKIEHERVLIVRVLHGARHLPTLLLPAIGTEPDPTP